MASPAVNMALMERRTHKVTTDTTANRPPKILEVGRTRISLSSKVTTNRLTNPIRTTHTLHINLSKGTKTPTLPTIRMLRKESEG